MFSNYAVAQNKLLFSCLSTVPLLTGSNYAEWIEIVTFSMSMLSFSDCLREDGPNVPAPDEKDVEVLKAYKDWKDKDGNCLSFLRLVTAMDIRNSISGAECDTTKKYLAKLKEKFEPSDKALIGQLLSELSHYKYDEKKADMAKHIMHIQSLASKLFKLGLKIEDPILTHFIFEGLPKEFEAFHVSYNAIKETWTVDELANKLVQEATRLSNAKGHNIPQAHFVHKSEGSKGKGQSKKKDWTSSKTSSSNVPGPSGIKKVKRKDVCHFCKKAGHFQNECTKRKEWFEKKGMYSSFVCFESNFINVPSNTWWLDSGANVHVSNSLQGFSSTRTIRSNERNLLMGNKSEASIEAIGCFSLELSSGFKLLLEDTIYVPSMSRNLISLSKLDSIGFSVTFGNGCFSLFKDNNIVGSGILENGMYRIELDKSFSDSLFISLNSEIGVKRVRSNENSAFLWHKRLAHISRERMMLLVKDNILPSLDFTDFGTCVDCIKGKQTKHTKRGATRSTALLEIIHTDICGPFDVPSFTGEKYFITFIDDYSRYCYLYMLHEKSQSVNAVELYIKEVERQLGKKVKIIRSDRGGEFYGRYDESGQHPGPFAKLLESLGIVAQYTMPGSPWMNGVAERRNRTLLEAVRAMMSKTNLPRSLWMHALMTAVYVANRVPSKAVSKTPFELWKGWKPSLRHLHIWGCPAEARIYNPQEKKLDSKTISGFFIGYASKSKGYKFYCPNHSTRIVETGNAKFLEDGEVSGRIDEVIINEIREETSVPISVPLISTHEVLIDAVDAGEQREDDEPQPINVTPAIPEVIEAADTPIAEVPVRRSTRPRRSAISDDYMVYMLQHEFDIGLDKDPVTFSQAVKGDDSDKWIDAMCEELKSMAANKVWELVALPIGHKAVGSKWVFKTKRDSLGQIERHKARLVAKGFNQKEGIDYNETFSPVSKKDSLRIILALVAHFDLELHQMDVKTAFLNGSLEEEVYMSQPEGFVEDGKEDLVCLLRKSIYGLKQASRQWYIKFHDTITAFGFTENIVDQCIYLKVSGSKFAFLVLYVDDILIASSDLSLLKETKSFLSSNFEMKDMGEASYVIGIEISRDRSQRTLGLSQKAYISKVLERFSMTGCNSSIVPIQKGDKLNLKQCPKSDEEHKRMQDIPYASIVGSLMYAQVCTRPDISFAVGVLGRYQSNPGMEHWKAAKKVLRYLQGTKSHMLTYRHSDQLEVIGYTDSDFGGCEDSRKSTSGYVFVLAGGAISWKSAKQTIIASSTMEAEFVACFEATNQGLWLRNFISGLSVLSSIARPLKIFCDNAAAVFFSKNDRYSKGIKHMEMKYLSVKEEVRKRTVSVEHISTSANIADPLTKGLPPKTFLMHASLMGLESST